jgi:hypothetical protein
MASHLCFFYVRLRSREPGLDFLAVGYGLLVVASTLAGEQACLRHEVWTLGSFSIGAVGYGAMAMGMKRAEIDRSRYRSQPLVAREAPKSDAAV